jgi:pyrroline-5-carboxylate reductase
MDRQKNALRLGCIGAGHMAEALIRGAISAGVCDPALVCVSDPAAERRKAFIDRFGVQAVADNRDAVRQVDVILLAVKPQMVATVLKGLRGAVPRDALVISIAAGIRTARIEQAMPPGQRVVRIMPNTPSLIGQGASAIAAGAAARPDDLDVAEWLMAAVGLTVRVDEADLDAVTAVSGSGPAYVFFLIEAMQDAAKDLGLQEDVGRRLVLQTVLGAAMLASKAAEDASVLRAKVTSPGGTTEAAVSVLCEGNASELWIRAIRAASRRSQELSCL